jgi:hypothetical protein
MYPNSMQAWIAGNYLQAISCGRITNNDGVDLVEERIKHKLILTGKAQSIFSKASVWQFHGAGQFLLYGDAF